MKWADYVISAVRYSSEPRHIVQIEVMDDIGEKVTNKRIESRQNVVTLLKLKHKIITIYKSENGWKKGDEINIFPVNGREYIKTEGNNKEEDNLGELPEF
jgi:hypothetical protein